MVEAAPETEAHFKEYAIEEFLVRDEPYYRPIGDEIELFTAAYRQHIPVLLKGPTGCGTRLRRGGVRNRLFGRPIQLRGPVSRLVPARRAAHRHLVTGRTGRRLACCAG